MFSRIDRALVALVGAVALAALVGLCCNCSQLDLEGGGGPPSLRPQLDAGAATPVECDEMGLEWIATGYCRSPGPRPPLVIHVWNDAGAEVR
jgi:hypothetical protein